MRNKNPHHKISRIQHERDGRAKKHSANFSTWLCNSSLPVGAQREIDSLIFTHEPNLRPIRRPVHKNNNGGEFEVNFFVVFFTLAAAIAKDNMYLFVSPVRILLLLRIGGLRKDTVEPSAPSKNRTYIGGLGNLYSIH